MFFFFGEVDFAELFGVVFVVEFFVSELFACQVKQTLSTIRQRNNIVAVIVSSVAEDAVYFAAENILNQECCN